MITVRLPLRLVSEANARDGWRAAHGRAQEQRGLVRMALGLRPIRPPCHCWITRIGPRRLDGDNLQRACKAVRDGVADALGIDDGSEAVTWAYDQRKPLPGERDLLGKPGGRAAERYGVIIQLLYA